MQRRKIRPAGVEKEGKFVPVPDEIFVPMKNFFRARFKRDPSKIIVEAINEKGAQARLDLKRRKQADL